MGAYKMLQANIVEQLQDGFIGTEFENIDFPSTNIKDNETYPSIYSYFTKVQSTKINPRIVERVCDIRICFFGDKDIRDELKMYEMQETLEYILADGVQIVKYDNGDVYKANILEGLTFAIVDDDKTLVLVCDFSYTVREILHEDGEDMNNLNLNM